MGRLTYASALVINFDDRTLAHLQVVIQAKLRRNESFYFTWIDEPVGAGRSVIWLHSSIPLCFNFVGAPTSLNRNWLTALLATANSPAGLHITPEPPPRATTGPRTNERALAHREA